MSRRGRPPRREGRPGGRDARRGAGNRDAGRAQTNALGYVLIFSVVVLSIGGIYTSGVTSLADQRGVTAFDNAERAMDIFADNAEDIYQEGAPSRGTEFKFYESSLATTGNTTLSVTISDPNEGTSRTYGPVHTTPLVYRSDEGTLAYDLGATVRTEKGGSVMTELPPFAFGERRVLLSVLLLEGEIAAGSTDSTMLAVLEHRETVLILSDKTS